MAVSFYPFTIRLALTTHTVLAYVQQADEDGDGWVLQEDRWLSHSTAVGSDCSWDVDEENIYQMEEDWLAVSNENKHVEQLIF